MHGICEFLLMDCVIETPECFIMVLYVKINFLIL